MTSLTITPNKTKKTATATGNVAAGEIVAVTVNGFASEATLPLKLKLRIMTGGKTVAMFPLEESDVWATSNGNATCTLRLDTTAAKEMCRRPETACYIVLEDNDAKILYAVGEYQLSGWPKESGVDEPIDIIHYEESLDSLVTACEALQAALAAHIARIDNPHTVTKFLLGLANVDNTSDTAKPVSTAQRAAINEAKTAALAAVTAEYNRAEPVERELLRLINLNNSLISEEAAARMGADTSLEAMLATKADKKKTVSGVQYNVVYEDSMSGKADKNTTYTKSEVDAIIAAVKTGSRQIVTSLPESGQGLVIYMVPRTTSETNNIYDEYLWLGQAWEKMGSTAIDLSNYATIVRMNAALELKVDKVAGKSLSTEDYTAEDKLKLSGIASGANKTTITAPSTSAEDSGKAADAKATGDALAQKLDRDEPYESAMAEVFSMDTDLSECATVQDVAILKLSQLLGE